MINRLPSQGCSSLQELLRGLWCGRKVARVLKRISSGGGGLLDTRCVSTHGLDLNCWNALMSRFRVAKFDVDGDGQSRKETRAAL